MVFRRAAKTTELYILQEVIEMKIFENGKFVEMSKEHRIYQLIQAAKAKLKSAEEEAQDE